MMEGEVCHRNSHSLDERNIRICYFMSVLSKVLLIQADPREVYLDFYRTIYQVYLTVWFISFGPFTGLESIVLFTGASKKKCIQRQSKANLNYGKE
ncbi:hypothetical protein EVAR_40999_1 [Eumeta japonica]|uniref:Uncharacterized protein n=1 Tax=Eumeta variegata TaxID=151549 RepID=A0A4C1XDK5_EUMVA|nr:hypothetical protein EVAR_40999_1 [Eumeta japonica]